MTRRPAATGAWLVALLALGGCSFDSPDVTRLRNTCVIDTDCGAGGRCGPEGMCLSSRTTTLLFEVVPPPVADLPGLPQPIGAAETTGFDNLELTVRQPVDLFGAIRAPSLGHPYASAVPARVTAELLDGIPGVPARVTTAALSAPVAPSESLDGLDMSYRVTVVPGHQYLLTFQPAEDAERLLPPVQEVVDVHDQSQRVDLEYPEALREIALRIVDHDGVPVSGLAVRALGGRGSARLSTVSVSDEAGEVRLLMSPTAPELPTFQIEPTVTGTLTPTYTIPTLGLGLADDGLRLVPLPEPTGSVWYRGTVVGTERNGMIVPAAGASLTFTNTGLGDPARGMMGTLRVVTTTDATGAFEVRLAPSATPYELAIVPAAEGDSGVLVQHTTIAQPPPSGVVMGQEFALPLRAALGGRVLAPDARPVANVTLEARPRTSLSAASGSLAEQLARSTNAATDADGAYRMLVDPGTYDVLVRAPVDSGFPWAILRGLEVRAATATQDITLPAPVPVGGFVRDAAGAAVAGATVNVYSLEQEPDAPPRTWLVGSARSAADGGYRLLAPSSLARGP